MAFIISPNAGAQIPKPIYGKIVRHSNISSSFVPLRNIDVWIPADYDTQKKYAVIYMHDGEMLFDSSLTWNKQSWHADRAVHELMKKKGMKDCIIVGIWNAGKNRHAEFCPQKPFESLPKPFRDSLVMYSKRNNGNQLLSTNVYSDNYLKFIVQELKPFIDSTYSTRRDRKNTFIAGSSMGGLISIYAICEYPEIFGGAACLSTHWPVLFSNNNNPFPKAMNDYLLKNIPDPKTHKIYFDYGGQTLDSLYKISQIRVDKTMKIKGYGKKNWLTLEFPKDDHSEKSWCRRLKIPFAFMLSK